MIYWQLFLSFLQVGLFSIGGGYAAIPLIQEQAVTAHAWLSMSEFTDLVTIAEMTPGPITINAATFVGIRIAGLPGAIVATLGSITPALFLVSLLAFLYYRYKNVSVLQSVLGSLRPAVVALIAAAGLSMLQEAVAPEGLEAALGGSVSWIGLALFAAAFVALRKFKQNPILVMALCGLANLALGVLLQQPAG